MKRLLLSVVFAMFCTLAVQAQHIAYNERTPRINLKKCRWLDDIVPAEGEYVYIGFIYSRSNSCLEFCYRIKKRLEESNSPLRVILVTREPERMVDSHLRPCLGGRIGTIIDEDGEIFRDFGIRYVPFGVLIDSRRRAVWFGNPLTAEKDIVGDIHGNHKNKEAAKNKKREKESK